MVIRIQSSRSLSRVFYIFITFSFIVVRFGPFRIMHFPSISHCVLESVSQVYSDINLQKGKTVWILGFFSVFNSFIYQNVLNYEGRCSEHINFVMNTFSSFNLGHLP